MKVTLGDFGKDMPRVQSERTNIDQRAMTKNKFKVLEVTDDDEVGQVVYVRRVVDSEESASATCGMEFGLAKMRDQVRCVNAVSRKDGWRSLGVGDIVVDSAADESCWPMRRKGMLTRRRRVLGG